MLLNAARVTSPVEHTSGLATELATWGGVGVAVIVTIAAPEITILGLLGAAATWVGGGNTVGHLADKYVMPNTASEWIEKGVDTVYIDEPKYEAANAGPKTLTSDHKKEVKTGALNAYIENRPFSRRTDMTKCDGQIMDGSPHVFVAGEPSEAPEGPGQALSGPTGAVEFALWLSGFTSIPKSVVEKIGFAKSRAEDAGADFGVFGETFDVITSIFDFS
jgi:hypothetical protein